jgi:Putative, 10TM heavy-metal exporter
MTPNGTPHQSTRPTLWWVAGVVAAWAVLQAGGLSLFPSAGQVAQELALMAVGLMGEAIAPAAMLLLAFGALEAWGARRGHDVFAASRRVHVPIAVVLGLLPGCGGALAVTMAWSTGRVSFGTWVATLTATMGDAALPLAAAAPASFATVWLLQALVALPTGWLVDALRWDPARPDALLKAACAHAGTAGRWDTHLLRGLALTGAVATAALLGVPVPDGALFALSALASAALLARALGFWRGGKGEDADRVQTVAAWIWGVGAAGLALAALLPTAQAGWVWEGPFGWALALLAGAIPGCAAILALGAAHAAGSVPLHVLAAAAVMTDGDAAAPVVARAPRAWMAATLASVPAATAVYLLLV